MNHFRLVLTGAAIWLATARNGMFAAAVESPPPTPFSFLSDIAGPVAFASMAWGDADRDGDLDLLICGGRYDSGGLRGSVLRNDRNGNLTASLAELTPVYHGGLAWGDFDRDGDLDVLLSGYSGGLSQSPAAALHRNNLPGGFGIVGLTRLPSLGNSAMACADADGDGDIDVLICGSTSSGIRQTGLYLNSGGSFSNALLTLPQVAEGAVAWSDYDNDGDPDFVLTGSTDGTLVGAVSRLYRNANGTFVEDPVVLPPVFRSAVAWADVDLDGDADLLIAGASSVGAVARLMRNVNGVLTATSIPLPGVVDGALAWGDANLDGFPDLALSGRLGLAGGNLISRVYWGGGATLTDGAVSLPGLHFSAMAWGDLDFDGRLDLAVAGSTNNALTIFNQGAYSAMFRNESNVTVSQPPPMPADLIAEISGSDVLVAWNIPPGIGSGLSFDLRVGRTPGGSDVMSPESDPVSGLRWVATAGQAGWAGRWRLRNLPPGNYFWAVQSVDAAYRGSAFSPEAQFSVVNVQPTITTIANQSMVMNGSLGPLQLILNDTDDDEAALEVSVAASIPRLFPEGSVQLSGVGPVRDVTFSPAVNEAGTATIIFTVRDPKGGISTSSTRVTVQSLVDFQAGIPDGQYPVIEPGDVDDDGDLDLLVSGLESTGPSSGRYTVKIYINNGGGSFSNSPASLPLVFNECFAAWGDYDADGDLDLFYAGIVYRREGSQLLPTGQSLGLTGIQYGQAAWGDYDRDGDLDLAVSGYISAGQYVTAIYRNDGNNLFFQINATLLPLYLSSIAWSDPDADGDLDLAVAGAAAENTLASPNGRVYRNEGGEQFVEAVNFFGVVGGNLTWGDVNGDGRVDLVATGYHGSELVNDLQLNVGGWQFSRLEVQPDGFNWADTRLLDWDADGDLDLLAGVNSIVAVYLNPDTGEYPISSTAPVGLRCRALRWGDFDNDADFDALVSGIASTGTSGTTRLYRNPRLNLQPLPPITPVATVEGNSAVLRWPSQPDVHGAPVTYNVRVGTAPGLGNVVSPLSRSDGRRLVPAPGNAGFARSLTLRALPPGSYFWTVQAVDHAWRGRPWLTTQSFTITSPLLPRIVSVALIDGIRLKVTFDALAGRDAAVESSINFGAWGQRASVLVGPSGKAETSFATSGDREFFRLRVQP